MLTMLFVLRLISAVLLLLFLAVLGWVMIQDMRLTAELIASRESPQGALRIMSTDSTLLAVGQKFDLMPVTGIGRAPDNTIIIEDEYASARHVLLTMRGKQWWLEDLNSSNGTFLNDQPVTRPVVISTGDNITIGTTVFRLEN